MLITQELRTFEKELIMDGEKPLTLKTVLLRTMVGDMRKPAAKEMSAEDAAKCFALGVRIASVESDEIDLEVEDKAFLLKQLENSYWTALVFGQCKLMLNDKPTGLV